MNLAELSGLFERQGCRYILFKRLAHNDDPKHGIWVGPNLEAASLLPNHGMRSGNGIPKADVDLHWLSDDGTTEQAPHAKLILYAQYPEIRLSGFLRGCAAAPSKALTDIEATRVLAFGVAERRRIVAWAASDQTELLAELDEAGQAGQTAQISVFRRLELGDDPKSTLLRALGKVHRRGWIKGQTLLADGNNKPNNSQNAGGLTLEAALGIPKDSDATPDFGDWEVKAYTVASFDKMGKSKPVTLMTPEPTRGIYAEHGAVEFLRRYGYPAVNGEKDRLNYSNRHLAGIPASRPSTSDPGIEITLRLRGFRPKGAGGGRAQFDLRDGAIELIDQDGQVAAGWPFEPMLDHWVGKHAFAVYVPVVRRQGSGGGYEYSYSDRVQLGIGTDFIRFLTAMHSHSAYYDPGMNVKHASTEKPVAHRRSQFRATVGHLNELYESFGSESVR